ncbi:hypothetical protein [Sphingobacterium deserti]|uniref:Uncharacterized protein n=1 Tax=Sphingobacterium deserti TaxID=1229276 RepID=A0A0B8T0J5_9SPHI|nr:hypothetical protein [Sphingobacterium deserti]KGE13866.1 hypothetical protein DI53_2395 [Sphingobacterium deserti]
MKENNTYHDGMEGLNLPESLRVSPFSVPTGYFDELTSKLSAQIGLKGKVPPEIQSFSVPNNYFDELKYSITAQVALANPDEEAQSWSTPSGYFETLQDTIQSRIMIESIDHTNESFTVPTGYFDALADRIQANIFEKDLHQVAQTDGYTTPPLYFEKLTATIVAKAKDTSPVSGNENKPVRRLNPQRWIQYAAAACVAAVLGTASYNAVMDHGQVNATETHLASIPEDEIINYLSTSNSSDDLVYIMEYISQPVETIESEGVCSKIKENDIEDYLNYML